jgi:hypothetical protein
MWKSEFFLKDDRRGTVWKGRGPGKGAEGKVRENGRESGHD